MATEKKGLQRKCDPEFSFLVPRVGLERAEAALGSVLSQEILVIVLAAPEAIRMHFGS